jgi:riboflavin kinase/FMN adenylyltransferase
VVVGENYRFGHHAAGDADELARLGRELGFAVTAVPLLSLEGERVSSSWIRELVSQGEVAHAATLLGRDPWLEGAVVRGEGRGRGLGVPTANLAWPPARVVPGRGVYAGLAVVGGPAGAERHGAAVSVGWNPTFGPGRELSVEAHLLDVDADLYGRPMRLEFRRFLRHELRFESVPELVDQMQADIEQARATVLELR